MSAGASTELLAAIATALPDPGTWRAEWTLIGGHWRITNGPLYFNVQVDGYQKEGRLTISSPHDHKTNITVSYARSAKAIAADIARRFLPDFIGQARGAAEYERERQAAEILQRDQADRVALASGGALVPGLTHMQRSYEIGLWDETGYQQAGLHAVIGNDPNSIELEFKWLPVATAEKLVTLFYTLHPTQPKETGNGKD